MDERKNPFAPGAGTQPPALAGRENIIERASVALGRVKEGRPARSQMFLGLRGVGKTVLLNRLSELADGEGFQTIMLEAPEDQELAVMLTVKLRSLLFRLSRLEHGKELAKRGLGVLRAFASAFKLKVGDIEFGVEAEIGTADSGNLEADLPELLLVVAEAAKQAKSAVAIFLDEVQYLSQRDLSALIVSLHTLSQKNLPLLLFGAGLPQLAALAGEAKSYAERLFEYPDVGRLAPEAAREAIEVPVRDEGAEIESGAVDFIIDRTNGYPYFLQEWGDHAWNKAAASPIVTDDVKSGSDEVLQRLDQGFFRVRLDRLTPREKDYVRAMAELGPGPHRSGDIANMLNIQVTAAGPLRSGLIKKGMIFSPQHGDTAFTVPMFDEFMWRSMPDWQPPKKSRTTGSSKKRSKRKKKSRRRK